MKEIKVGERVTIEAVEQEGCEGCFFDRMGKYIGKCFEIPCSNEERSDHKDVIFKEVKE